jgi:hypothetical protein
MGLRMLAALAAALTMGLGLGAWSAFAYINGDVGALKLRNGQWTTDPAIGSMDAGAYTRAAIAQRGLLALAKEETVYFFTDRDSQGRRFTPNCYYRFKGNALPARWWSYTLYAEDDFLPGNGESAFSVSASTVSWKVDGTYYIDVGTVRQSASNWLSSRDAGAFSLTVRMYNPDQSVIEDPSTVSLPSVERLNCSGDA